MKQVHVAVGLIVNGAGDVLLAKRAAHQHQGGLWEFPGGKVEAGEPVRQALARELAEELGIQLSSARPYLQVAHNYSDKSVLLDVWLVDGFTGEPVGVEGQPLRWVPKIELKNYQFPAANLPILNAYLLGEHLLISGAIDVDNFAAQLAASLAKRKPSAFMLRAPELTLVQYQALALIAAGICAEQGLALVLNHPAAIDVAKFVNTNFPALTLAAHANRHQRLSQWREQLPAAVLLGASCHDQQELLQADAFADFVLLSPVKSTRSHPEAESLGWSNFARLAAQTALPVMALGGITAGDLAQIKQNNGFGCAGISDGWCV